MAGAVAALTAALAAAAACGQNGSMRLDPAAALVVIDVQRAIDHPSWGERNNPALEANLSRLLGAWRSAARAVYHVRHASTEPGSTYAPDQPGFDWKSEAIPRAGEEVVTKRHQSAFAGTDLEARLRRGGHGQLVVAGVVTNNSVEATVRWAANLGLDVIVLSDATATFEKRDLRGRRWDADDVHALSLANLAGEYARVASTDDVLVALADTTHRE